MIRLHDVTLCCIDTAQPGLALRALRKSREHCAFAACLLLTDAAVAADGVEVRRIAPMTQARDYSDFVLKRLLAHIATPFVLLVQWDGWVIDAARWEDGFRACDYIGAPWNWHEPARRVGNGGFSLRSRRLLEVLADPRVPLGHPEDELIGRVLRGALETQGIRFADVATARRFSVEADSDPAPSFGFHSLYNFWRAVPPAELPELLAAMDRAALVSLRGISLLLNYRALRRWTEAGLLLRAMEAALGEAGVVRSLSDVPGGADGAAIRAEIVAHGG